MERFGIYLGLLVLGGSAGVLGSSYYKETRSPGTNSAAAIPARVQSPTVVVPSAPITDATPPNFIAAAVQEVGPAVVRIDASRKVTGSLQREGRFFRRFSGEESPVERGTGSGFILSPEGRLLTNAHVVAGADRVKVTLPDGRVFEGQVVGSDPVTDIAAIEIEGDNLPSVRLGQSQSLVPGEWAIAIGNPLGLNNTATVGIISALNRSSSQVGVPNQRVRFIQTDAAINPGNSGGPLLNARGEVIGVNAAIRADARGLGFAIPIETATSIAERLFAREEIDHPYIGIRMVTLTEDARQELGEDLGLPTSVEKGVLIVGIVKESPALEAGLRPGDLIVSVGGEEVETSTQVQQQVEASQIGEVLEVEIWRQDEQLTIEVRPGAVPEE